MDSSGELLVDIDGQTGEKRSQANMTIEFKQCLNFTSHYDSSSASLNEEFTHDRLDGVIDIELLIEVETNTPRRHLVEFIYIDLQFEFLEIGTLIAILLDVQLIDSVA